MEQLQAIAYAVLTQECYIREILPEERRNNTYCRYNSQYGKHTWTPHNESLNDAALQRQIRTEISAIRDARSLCLYMQNNEKRVVWNFRNTVRWSREEIEKGTIEFRGGRHLRGGAMTKRWITFAVTFISMAITKVKPTELILIATDRRQDYLQSGVVPNDVDQWWDELRTQAILLNLEDLLPDDWDDMRNPPSPPWTDHIIQKKISERSLRKELDEHDRAEREAIQKREASQKRDADRERAERTALLFNKKAREENLTEKRRKREADLAADKERRRERDAKWEADNASKATKIQNLRNKLRDIDNRLAALPAEGAKNREDFEKAKIQAKVDSNNLVFKKGSLFETRRKRERKENEERKRHRESMIEQADIKADMESVRIDQEESSLLKERDSTKVKCREVESQLEKNRKTQKEIRYREDGVKEGWGEFAMDTVSSLTSGIARMFS